MEMYGFWRSQATFRLRVALRLKNIDYHEIAIPIDSGGQDDPAFRKINPMGSVPVLMAGDRPLTQSLAILEYLDETQPDPPLLPSDALGRARVRGLAAIVAADTHPLIAPRIRRYLAAHADFEATRWKAWQAHWFTAGLTGLEARLAEPETGTFCHGEAPTLADICLVGLYAGAETFKIDLPDLPTITRIVAQCRQIPAFAESAAQRQADYPG